MTDRVELKFQIPDDDVVDPQVYAPGKLAVNPDGNDELKEPTPPKVQVSDELDYGKFEKEILKLAKAKFEEMKRGKISSKPDPEVVQKPEVLKPLEFVTESPFTVLPQLSAVHHPLYQGKTEDNLVNVGGHDWLKTLDQLRAAGWPYYERQDNQESIEGFLLKSAWIVFRELNYVVISVMKEGSAVALDMLQYVSEATLKNPTKTDKERELAAFMLFKKDLLSRKFEYVNSIEKFCMAYPETARQVLRLIRGYNMLTKNIKAKLGSRAFIPHNVNEHVSNGAPLKCPPADQSLEIAGIPVKNFLRHWTELNTRNTTLINTDKGPKSIPQCQVPSDLQFSWIPVEYREKIEEEYNLIQFRYTEPSAFRDFVTTLTKHQDLDDMVRTIDEDTEKPFIFVQDEKNKTYQMFLGSLDLDYNTSHLSRDKWGMKEGEEKSLREWMADRKMESDPKMYPLVHFLLNAPAPEKSLWEREGLIYAASYRKTVLRLMCADIPAKVFRDQIVKRYIGTSPMPGEDVTDCIDRFIKQVYDIIKMKKVIPELPERCPMEYRDALVDLLEIGGQSLSCMNSSTMLVTPSNSSIRTRAPMSLTKKGLSSYSESEKRKLFNDLVNVSDEVWGF